MSIGSSVRKLFGRHERYIADLYRAAFVSLPDLIMQIYGFRQDPLEILELGCGEGAMTGLLASRFAHSKITALDIAPNLGRLYEGAHEQVEFLQMDLPTFMSIYPLKRFDLVIMADVLHHVTENRTKLLEYICDVMTPRGGFVLKDLDRSLHPVFLAAYLADYYITGDRSVSFHAKEQLHQMLTEVFGENAVSECSYVRPWKSNVVFFVDGGAR